MQELTQKHQELYEKLIRRINDNGLLEIVETEELIKGIDDLVDSLLNKQEYGMKYIRTKDGIYKVEDKISAPDGEGEPFKLFYKVVGKAELINSTRVVCKADTIEELCDMFVLEFEGKHLFYKDSFKARLKAISLSYYKLYGAIWNDKGLIYVAKMNEKGELELI